jgi:hypothetical protein
MSIRVNRSRNMSIDLKVGDVVTLQRTKDQHNGYPARDLPVPARIIADYPNFLVVIILPHKNPEGLYMSSPYKVTVDKHELRLGVMKITGGKT